MRINLLHVRGNSEIHQLSKHLVNLAAEEFQVNVKKLWSQLYQGYDPLGEQIAQVLRDLGWQLEWYRLPHPDISDDTGMEQFECLSCGFVLNNACDLLIQWKLQHGGG